MDSPQPVTVRWESGDQTAIAIDGDATVPLVGAGTIAWSPRGLTLVGDLQRASKLAGGIAAGAGLIGGFLVAMMWQAEQWPLTLIVVALACFGAAGAGFARRRGRLVPTHLEVTWDRVRRVAEQAIDGTWAVTLREPRGTVRFQIGDDDQAHQFHEAMIAAAELTLTTVSFCGREVPRAEVVSRAGGD